MDAPDFKPSLRAALCSLALLGVISGPAFADSGQDSGQNHAASNGKKAVDNSMNGKATGSGSSGRNIGGESAGAKPSGPYKHSSANSKKAVDNTNHGTPTGSGGKGGGSD